MQRINDVIQMGDERYRILTMSGNFVIWINIDSAKAFPEVVTTDQIEQWILDESLRKLDDPFSYLATIPVQQGANAQKIRDERNELIAPLLADEEIYYRSGRGQYPTRCYRITASPVEKTRRKLPRRNWGGPEKRPQALALQLIRLLRECSASYLIGITSMIRGAPCPMPTENSWICLRRQIQMCTERITQR